MLTNQKNSVYRRLLRYILPHWVILAAGLVAVALQAGISGYVPLLVRDLVARLGMPEGGSIWWIPMLVVAVFLGRAVAGFVGVYALSSVGRDLIRQLRAQLFDYYLVMPGSELTRTGGASLISKMIYDSEQIAEAVSISVTSLVRDSLTIVALLGVMLYMSWQLTAMTAVVAPIIGLLLAGLSRAFRRYSVRIQGSMGDVTRAVEQSLRGRRVIKLFHGGEHECAQFETINQKNFRLKMRLVVVRAAGNATTQYVTALAIAAVIFVAFSNSVFSGLDAALFVGFLTAMAQLLSPLKRLVTINASFQRGLAGAQSLFETVAGPVERDDGAVSVERAEGDIEFRQVSFSYPDQDVRVLDGINLVLPARSTLALVGRSGSGKSTVASLIARFHDVDGGTILLDGTDIRRYALRDLRRQLSLVSQDVVLFDDTIAANIAYGARADSSRNRIEQAAEAACVTEFAAKLPDGLDTRIGEQGTLLSGGQRQRIAIARALLKDAPVLILDEATSALDAQSESRVQAALEMLMRGRTTLVIAHRLSTIQGADCIAVMREGVVVEAGTHAELLAHDGDYAALHRLQFGGEVF